MSSLSMNMSSSSEDDFTMSSSEVADRIAVMQQQESNTYACSDYIGNGNGHQSSKSVDRECRVKMIEWTYQVVDFCKFSRNTVAISTSYLDRFLSTSSPSAQRALVSKKVYQLAAMVTLYLSVKLFEPMAMDPTLLAEISQGCYTEQEIESMEQEILTALQWRLNGPTSLDFMTHILSLLPKSANSTDNSAMMALIDFSRFQVELSVCDYDLSLQRKSTIALASILNSLEGIDEKIISAQQRFEFIQRIATLSTIDPFLVEINTARIRLLKLFSQNVGYQLPQVAGLIPIVCDSEPSCNIESSLQKDDAAYSPVSVPKLSRRGSVARCA